VLIVGVLIGLVLLVVWAIRRITNSQGGSLFSSGQAEARLTTARKILKARFARGEITCEEYLQMREDYG
jgi:putative membrane protein